MTNKNHKLELKDLTIEEVLAVILGPLQFSFGLCLVFFMGLLGASLINGGTQENNSFQTQFCVLNTCFLPLKTYAIICIILIVASGIFIIVSSRKFNPRKKFTVLIFSSIIILFFIVYVTGGLHDSPFAAAVAVYVSSYFIILTFGVVLSAGNADYYY